MIFCAINLYKKMNMCTWVKTTVGRKWEASSDVVRAIRGTSFVASVSKLHRCIPVREQNRNTEAVNQPRWLFSVAHTDYIVAARLIATACSCRLQYQPSLSKCPNSRLTPKSGQNLSNSIFIILRPCKLLPWKVGVRALLPQPLCCPRTGLCWHTEFWKGRVQLGGRWKGLISFDGLSTVLSTTRKETRYSDRRFWYDIFVNCNWVDTRWQ
jgi:hypothetical protein